MTLFHFAGDLVTWKRTSAYVLDSVVAWASVPGDRQPVRASLIQVHLGGTPSGTVTISGLVDGAPDTEVLTWTGSAGFRVSKKRFTGSLTFAVSAGAQGGLVEAKAVGAGGEPQMALEVVKGPGHPVTIEDVTEGDSPVRRQGSQAEGTHRLLVQYEDVWEPRRGDRVVNDTTGDVYEVRRVERKGNGLWTTHWACKARREDSKGTV